jgi:hypothetical protein
MIAIAFAVLLSGAAPSTAASTVHDREFWRGIVRSGYSVPAGETAIDLIRELNGYLSSPDPELRDEFAYSITAAWVYQRRLVQPDALKSLESEWRANLAEHVGDRNTDTVLLRSFSALNLSVLAALDNAAPFLTEDEYRRLLSAAIGYLGAERDLRGHDHARGWLHATAHTADLLKFLCRNPHLRIEEQALVLRGLARRLETADIVFTHGETDRLGRVVLSLYGRTDLDRDGFRAWLAQLEAPPIDAHVTDDALTRRENVKNFLVGLYALAAAAPSDLSAKVADLQPDVLGALKRFM